MRVLFSETDVFMARKKKTAASKTSKKASRRKRIPWTPADLKYLRANAGKMPLRALARALKRSPSAVQFKAWSARISTRQKSNK
jgi:hypothetical protein